MFEKARLKLTVIYLIIIMSISLFFSLIIYGSAAQEFSRIEYRQKRIIHEITQRYQAGEPRKTILMDIIDYDEIEKARSRFIISLVFVNLIILATSGVASYSLADKTLEPIKKMVDEQKRFISDSSHELRTPITSLRTETEIALRNKNLTLLSAKRILKSNLDEIISLQTLSDRLLELAQNNKKYNKDLMKTVSIKKITENAIFKTQNLAKNKNIKIKSKVKDIKVEGIENRLTEVFVILIDNAIKYSPKKSNIGLSSTATRGKVSVSVVDQGIGIEKDELDNIFDRFYRSDSSRSESGFGLGLSIAKKTVEAHSGSIKVESKKNKYSKFTVVLPQK